MASVTPAVGEVGFAPHLSDSQTHTNPNDTAAKPAAKARIERIGSVRILRGGEGWRGVALRLMKADTSDERFELALTEGDGRSITVAVVEQEEAVALWRDCGRASGLPLLLETSDGAISEPYPQIGRLALGPLRIRRRYGLLAGRRPRFLVRRKTGKLAERPVILTGESMTDWAETS